jgi:CRP-like cAMP-binding protein
MTIRMDDKLKTLAEVPLFAGCSKKELQAVARLSVPFDLQAGQVLTKEGTIGRECFVIVDGKANVSIGGTAVGALGPGSCVGELALLDGGPRTATVVADGPISVYVLSVAEFRSLLLLNHTFARKLAVSLAQRLRQLEVAAIH